MTERGIRTLLFVACLLVVVTPRLSAEPTATPGPTGTPCPPLLSQNFDGVTAPALPVGWTSTASGAEGPWVTATAHPVSDPNSAFGPAVTNVGNTELISPVVAVPAAGGVLAFQNLFNLQPHQSNPAIGRDGMVLEISIDGGAFADIVTAGGTFALGGYTHTISTQFMSPIAGRMAWSGLSAGSTVSPQPIVSAVTLPAAAGGHNIQLKWRVATDNSIAVGAGVNIDDIVIVPAGCDVIPTPTPEASCAPVITQSTSQALTPGSYSCNSGPPNFLDSGNHYWRAFDMASVTGGEAFYVTGVSFGIEQAVSQSFQVVNIILYRQTSGVFPGGTRTQIGFATLDLVTQKTPIFAGAPLEATVPAGTNQLIMEVTRTNGGGSGSFFIGSNAAPQTGPSYISAPTCGVTNPTDLATIGHPDMHIVMNVHGYWFCPGGITPTPTPTPTPSPIPGTSLTPGMQDFGSVAVGSSSNPFQFTVHNNQGAPALGLSLTLSGPDEESFAITTNNCGSTLPVGMSCTLSVTFSPVTVGPNTASLTVSGSNSGSHTATLTGLGKEITTPTPTPTPETSCAPVITQSSSQAITPGSFSCNGGPPNFINLGNSYWRAFDMASVTGGEPFYVTSISFGIERAVSQQFQLVDVHLYRQTSGVFPGGTRTLIGSAFLDLMDQKGVVVGWPLVATVPAGTSELIMEVSAPGGDSSSFFIGSNAAPQTGPSYISAASCNLTNPTDLATIGFPDMHIVLNVHGYWFCPGGTTPTPTPTVTPGTPTPTPTATATATPIEVTHAANLSTRLQVGTGNNVGIGGFMITGTSPKQVVLRGMRPALGGLGVPDPLADPYLELRDASGAVIGFNDNWCDPPNDICDLIIATGLPPGSPFDAVILITLEPGAYTVILGGTNNGTGVGLVEIYDVGQGGSSRLANISTRGSVGTGDDILIAGVLLNGGSGSGPIVFRGLGPSLSNSGLTGVLADPTLELRDSNGVIIRANNNWIEDPFGKVNVYGLAPPNVVESAFVIELLPGAYTALLSGVNGETGLGLVEIYDLGALP